MAPEAVCNNPYILFRDDLMNANADDKNKTLYHMRLECLLSFLHTLST